MASSKQYKKLTKELARLRCELLPKEFSLSGDYPPEVFTKTVAYRVLAHAEIESYIEDRAYEAALTATTEWENSKKVSKTLLGLLAFSGQTMGEPPDSVNPSQPSQTSNWDDKIRISNKIKTAMNIFYNAIINNHGIKEKNILRLLLPIGIEVDKLDPVLLADLNSFAEVRGEAAHLSASKYRAKQQINPKDELRTVESLANRLIDIDRCIDQLLS
ncbi:MAG TPA: HEPN domain-containing protein [Dehalococcoidales bacterium]|nr:HEPN domain-containing protein [Dehalococcoidales bacterium]